MPVAPSIYSIGTRGRIERRRVAAAWPLSTNLDEIATNA
jgi:hypothetical protein